MKDFLEKLQHQCLQNIYEDFKELVAVDNVNSIKLEQKVTN
jgi:hypothetical protein